MALQKDIPLPNGIVATYHRVVRGIVDFNTLKTTLEMESYINKEARDDGKQPVTGISLTVDELPAFNGDPRPWAYAQFKARDEWKDATDV